MNQKNQLRKNPSRETCESIIRRILMTELTQNGKNRHFRKAADFMSYFESLYPASDALTKQVQRAVQSLHMPKDADGFFIVDKTAAQVEQEQCLGKLFADANVSLHPMEQVETVFRPYPPICRNFCCIHSNRVISLPGRFLPSFAPVMVC